MMNRQLRRTLERVAKKLPRLPSQACVLWVPSAIPSSLVALLS